MFCVGLCFVVHYFVSFLVSQSSNEEERERAGCLAIIDFRMSYYCKCSVALPKGTMGRSAVCDCCISC